MLTDAAWKGKKLADVVPALAAAGVAPRQIGAVLDVVSAQATAFPRGRVDLLRASPRVLATLEGIDAPLAERLTATRGSLDAASKADLAWPLSQGVLSTQQFAAIADKVTNRSLQWRIRVRASVDRLGGTTAAAMPTASGDQAPPVGMLLDAIIDCSGPTVRVVGMYEATWQAVASAVARERRVPEAEDAGATAEASLPVESAPPSGLNEESRRAKPRRPAAPPDMVSSRRARGGLRSEDSRVPPPVDDGSPIVEGSEPLPRADGSEPVRESPPGDSVGGRSGRWRPR